MTIKTVLVDFDGVIRHWPNSNTAIEKKHCLPGGSILKTAFSDNLLLPVIRGQTSDLEWRSAIARSLSQLYFIPSSELAVVEWSKSIGTIDVEVMSLLNSIENTKLALVTNATSRLASDLAAHGIDEVFEYIFNSSDIGYIKPETEFFTHVLDCIGVQAGDAVFIDDSRKNVEAATTMGIYSHHFNGIGNLREYLFKAQRN